ncbi:hypothetical protein [Streptomyces sp. NBC_00564]|uniref:hypothetical protein n=1 Tax=Streptomyces sp. NBC_00564 TaxID=2903663 RepID=UPI00352D7900|nr:hypothetical protein OG256_15930 [Streptomyces sp. NBC_00564]
MPGAVREAGAGHTPSVWQLARRRPLLFALFETVLTAGCAFTWYGLAALIGLRDRAGEAGDPELTYRHPLFVLAFVALAGLPVTWAARIFPSPRLRRVLERVLVARLGFSVLVSAGAALLLALGLY